MAKSIKDWQTEIHQLALEKGWYDKPRTALELHMLFVSEIVEASEAVRSGMPEIYKLTPAEPQPEQFLLRANQAYFHEAKHLKPEGEAIELADCVIRIMDYFESKGWDLDYCINLKNEYNKTRGYRHGNKLY